MYHGLVEEGIALEGLDGCRCTRHLLVDDEGLASVLGGLGDDHVQDLSELTEKGIQALCQLYDMIHTDLKRGDLPILLSFSFRFLM